MVHQLNVPVSVLLAFDHKKRLVVPRKVLFEGKLYQIIKLGFHHTYYEGGTLMHVFSVVADSVFFRLVLNTFTLHWRLTEIADEEVN